MVKSGILGIAIVVALVVSGWTQTNPPEMSNYVAEGTRFIVKLDDKLDTGKLKPGKSFSAKLAEDLVAPNGTIIPRGKKLKGHISEAGSGFHGRLLLSFTEVQTRKGWVPLAATVTDVPGEKSVQVTGAEGEIERSGSVGRRVIETAAVGAGLGAAAGAVAGGAHGAMIGAAAGGAVGGGAGLLTGRSLVLEKGQQLELRLDRQVEVPR